MKTKRFFIIIFVIALVLTLVLVSLEAYYIAIALIAGILIIGHREIWSLIIKRKFPPIDERVKENTDKSIRNGFIYYVVALAFLMLPFSAGITKSSDTVNILGGLFVSGGLVYMMSYVFYDRIEPRLGERGLKMLKIFLLIAGISLAVFIISVVLHNVIYGAFIHWFGDDFWDRTGIKDEPVFFIIALLSVLSFIVGIMGSLVLFIKGLFAKAG